MNRNVRGAGVLAGLFSYYTAAVVVLLLLNRVWAAQNQSQAAPFRYATREELKGAELIPIDLARLFKILFCQRLAVPHSQPIRNEG